MAPKKPNEAIWILESCNFFKDAMQNIFSSVLQNATISEKLQMKALKKVWQQKYNSQNRQPKSNPLPKPKRAPRKRTIKTEQKTTAPPIETLPQEESADPNTLDDDVDIVYRINIPPLRPHWPLRSIDLHVKAYICKKKLIEPLINWEILDRIMELPLEQATALMQSHVDNSLQSADI